CRDLLLYNALQFSQRVWETLLGHAKPKPEVAGHAKAVARRKQDAMLRGPPAEVARVPPPDQPWEAGHAASGPDPTHNIREPGKEAVESSKVCRSYAAQPGKDCLSMLHGSDRHCFANRSVRDREVRPSVQVLLHAFPVALHDPANSEPAQAESLR